MLSVTAFFAGISGLMLVLLSVNVIMGRYKHKVALGDGGKDDMNRRIRAQMNFVEYVPLALLLMGLNEMQGASPEFIGAMGCLLILGRISHGFSLIYFEPKHGKILFRQMGMAATLTPIICLSLPLLT